LTATTTPDIPGKKLSFQLIRAGVRDSPRIWFTNDKKRIPKLLRRHKSFATNDVEMSESLCFGASLSLESC
jgi:hypothetical protein